MPKGLLQVVHVNNWIVALTLESDKADITVYDLLNATITTTMQVVTLTKLVNNKNDFLTIEVNTQSGTKECGLWARPFSCL